MGYKYFDGGGTCRSVAQPEQHSPWRDVQFWIAVMPAMFLGSIWTGALVLALTGWFVSGVISGLLTGLLVALIIGRKAAKSFSAETCTYGGSMTPCSEGYEPLLPPNSVAAIIAATIPKT